MNWRVALAVLGCVVALLSTAAAQEPAAAPQVSPFVGADACKEFMRTTIRSGPTPSTPSHSTG